MRDNSTPIPAGKSADASDLREVVEYRIDTKPFAYDGYKWAALDQPTYASILGVTVKTVQRWLAKPPFVTTRKVVDRRKLCLVRIGEPDPPSPADDPLVLAKVMSNLWTKELRAIRKREIADWRAAGDDARAAKLEALKPRSTSGHEYGMMIGLANEWPAEHAVAIFAYVIREWSTFMAGVKLAIELLPPEEQIRRFFRYPAVTVVRRFPEVASDAWVMHMQEHHPSGLGVESHKLFA